MYQKNALYFMQIFFVMRCFLLLILFGVQGIGRAQNKAFWISNVNLVNTSTGKIVPAQTVVVEAGLIKQVTKFNKKLPVPDSVIAIDGTGKFLMPGMIDGHIHFFQSGGLYTRPDAIDLNKVYAYTKDQQWIKDNLKDLMRRYLACGVTTVMDVGGPMSNFDVRRQNDSNFLAPNAFVTGPLISTYQPPNLDKKDPPIVKVNNEAEARELVQKQVPFKPDFIKIWFIVLPNMPAAKSLPIVKAVIDESHKNNLKVCVHATEYETATLAVEAGADILVHSIDDKTADDKFLTLLKTKKVVYIPTAIVASKYNEVFSQQHRLTAHDFKYANPFMLGTLFDVQHIPKNQLGFDYTKIKKQMPVPSATDSMIWQNLKRVSNAGITIAAGTDAGNIGTQHGASYYTELMAMRHSGMTNAQVLKAATIDAAIGFGKQQILGSIEQGKMANPLLLNANPLDTLDNLHSMTHVFNRGHLIKADTLLPVTPEILAQQQLNAYNARDVDAFLAPYADSVSLYGYPNQFFEKGLDKMRVSYGKMFKSIPNLHCELVNRMVQGNTIIDHESVTGFGPKPVRAIAIYTIKNGKIESVRFIE
jgi:imidazolonepropionase-like amidohydrolase